MNGVLPQHALLSADFCALSTGLFMVLPTLNLARHLGHRTLSILPVVNTSGQKLKRKNTQADINPGD